MTLPLLQCEATIRLKVVLSLVQCVSGEGFLVPFRNSVGSIDWGDPRPGYARVGAEIERIEQSFRLMAAQIKGFFAVPPGTVTIEGVPLDENDVLAHLQLTKDDVNFLSEIGAILPSIANSLHECSTACKREDLTLEEITARVATASTIVSQGAERFHPYRGQVLRMLCAKGKTKYSINQAGRVVHNELRQE
jgi:hypothetical protein